MLLMHVFTFDLRAFKLAKTCYTMKNNEVLIMNTCDIYLTLLIEKDI